MNIKEVVLRGSYDGGAIEWSISEGGIYRTTRQVESACGAACVRQA